MNHKNIIFAFLTIVLICSSCNKSSDLSNTIPADAKYVLHVDAKSLVEKSEYDIFQNEAIQNAINMGKVLMKDKDQIKLIEDFLKDANSMGLNLKNDFYIYSNYNVYGVVLGVNDAKKLKEVLIKTSLAKEDDITKDRGDYIISPTQGACLVWNKDKMLLLVDISKVYLSDNNAIDINALAKEYLNQSVNKSINSNKAYREFSKNKKDISSFYSTEGLSATLDEKGFWNLYPDMLSFQKGLKNIEGVSVGAYASFDKGAIKYNTKFFYNSPETETRFKNLLAQFSGNLKGEQLKYIPAKPIFLATVNLKGESVSNYLETLGAFALMENNTDSITSIAQKVLKNVDGDVTFALTSTDKLTSSENYNEEGVLDQIPQYTLFADVTNSHEVLDMITSELKNGQTDCTEIQTECTEISPSVFSISLDNVKVYVGVVNNMFFMTFDESVYNNLNNSAIKNNYADKIKNKSAFMCGDLQLINAYFYKHSYQYSSSQMADILKMILDPMSGYEFSISSEDYSTQGSLLFVDKESNSLKTICKKIDELITLQFSKFNLF